MAALYAVMQALMEAITRFYFRAVETFHRDRFPAHGGVLIVANHPATWTDVVLLDASLDRKLHFLAHQPLFRPWPRRLLLALFSALPVWHRQDDPEAPAHNRVTFDRCHALLRGGEAIAAFPEAVSGGERSLEPLKTGTARLILEHIARFGEAPCVIPVAIHYEDRTAFRTRVVLEVGPPMAIAVADHLEAWSRDPDTAAHTLTSGIRQALEVSLAAAARHARATAAAPSGAAAPGALVAAASAAGTALHVVAALVIEALARRLAKQPQQIAFARIAAGLVVLPLWYAGLVALAAALGGGAWFAAPAVAPLLGALACRDVDRRRSRAAPPSGAEAP